MQPPAWGFGMMLSFSNVLHGPLMRPLLSDTDVADQLNKRHNTVFIRSVDLDSFREPVNIVVLSIPAMSSKEDNVVLPAPAVDQTYVTISALQAGHLTLPEKLFVTDADPEKRATVPSLSFLIQHPSRTNHSKKDKLIFDLGLKRDFSGYREAQQQHIAQRQPTIVSPDAADSLRKGGLDPKNVDTVILSHVHWDHVGTPSDFPNSEFVVGSGTMHLLANGGGPLYPAEIFNHNELPHSRTRELPPARNEDTSRASDRQTNHTWHPLAGFPAAIDFYNDGSLYVIDAPGHLPGHINLLARIAPKKWVYLGGDCCHDPRILSGEKGIALYDDGRGGLRSVHADTDEAARPVERAARLLKKGQVQEEGGGVVDVDVVVAHDRGWAEGNGARFWPGTL
jgi:glyoxylase-like metal-dependent hydrolase (beta-lactamase superfamily II)